MSALSNGSYSKSSPPTAPKATANLVKKPTTRGSTSLSVRSVFGGARAAASKKDKDSAHPDPVRPDSDLTSGAETETRRAPAPSRFGFGIGSTKRSSLSSKPEPVKKPPVPARSTPTPTSTTPTAGSLRAKPGSPTLRRALTPTSNKPPSPVARTPASIRSILTATNYNGSPGPLSDPVINLAASTSNRILDFQAKPSEDMTAPGDLTIADLVMSDGTPRKAAEEDDAEEEGNVSALLPMVDFGAPTPAHPRILIQRVNANHDDEDDDEDDDDLDNDNDDDPTVFLQMETPSRPSLKKPPKQSSNGLPSRQNLSYLSPQPPTPGSLSFFSRSRRQRLPSNNSSASKSRRTSAASNASASRRSSKIRPGGGMERGSILSWEAVLERSKEFSDADVDELGMISTIGLGGLGAMSPGFGTPMYNRLSFTTGATDRDRSVSSRRTSQAVRRSRTSQTTKENEVVVSANTSDAGSAPGSARLQPPETPSPLGASTLSKKSPIGLTFTPLDPAPKTTRGRTSKEQSAADKLKKQLDSQTAQLQAVQQQLEIVMRDLEIRNATVTSLEETRAQFLKERLEFEAAKQQWAQKEAAWVSRQQAWTKSQQRSQEVNDLKEVLEIENGIKSRWSAISEEIERETQRIARDRELLSILLADVELWMCKCETDLSP
ncbi:hypothetical protein FRC00_005681 [Tulasnella sp. 408]|nr:hypothetical protein FRC00_005681 [Tulasnella sp. 408]